MLRIVDIGADAGMRDAVMPSQDRTLNIPALDLLGQRLH
jgi:hypothetical protein